MNKLLFLSLLIISCAALYGMQQQNQEKVPAQRFFPHYLPAADNVLDPAIDQNLEQLKKVSTNEKVAPIHVYLDSKKTNI